MTSRKAAPQDQQASRWRCGGDVTAALSRQVSEALTRRVQCQARQHHWWTLYPVWPFVHQHQPPWGVSLSMAFCGISL